jgi:hypothetical protein
MMNKNPSMTGFLRAIFVSSCLRGFLEENHEGTKTRRLHEENRSYLNFYSSREFGIILDSNVRVRLTGDGMAPCGLAASLLANHATAPRRQQSISWFLVPLRSRRRSTILSKPVV